MGYFDKRPRSFRGLFILLSAFLVALASVTIYRYAKAPSDENWFRDSPSRLFVTRDIESAQSVPGAGPTSTNILHAGDLLLSANGMKVKTLEDLHSSFASIDTSSHITLNAFRPREDKTYSVSIRADQFEEDLVREIRPTALVIEVIEGGASDRAGMKVGDLIVRINGEEFETANHADLILRRAQIGKTIDYEVLRAHERVTLHVTLASFGFPIALLIFVLSGVFFLVTGIFLGIARPRIAAARLLGLFFVSIGFFMTVVFIQRDVEPDLFVRIRNFTMLIALFLGFAFFLHSCHYFPTESPNLLARKWLRRGGYILALVPVPLILIFGQPAFIAGILASAFYALVLPVFFRKGALSEYRQQVRLVRWTGILAGAATMAVFWLSGGIGPSNVQALTLAGIFLATIPLSYLYTIAHFRLLDLNIRVRLGVQYSIVSALWGIAALGVLVWALLQLPGIHLDPPNIRVTGASIEVLDEPMPPVRREMFERGAVIVGAIGLAFLAWKGRRAGQRLIDKKFYRSQYDYRRAGAELADVMATRLNMSDLARGIAEKLTELMRLKRAGVVFFKDESACCCQEAQGFDGEGWKNFCISAKGEVAEAIKRFRGEFSIDYLPPHIKENFRENEFRYIIPIRSKEKLVGAMLVGEKLSESPFQQEDLEFLASGAKQASVAIENAFLYDELAEQERMKHELAIARRIQLESLPQKTPNVPGLDVAGISIPAMEVGGDYFDYLNGDVGMLTVVVGDVSGKGTSAALYMSKVQGILRSLHGFGLPMRELFIRTNTLLRGDMEKKSFVTALAAKFNTPLRTLTFARAGHLPLFHYSSRSGRVESIVPRGLGLGLSAVEFFSTELEEMTVEYGPGDVFLFVTDGVTEGQRTDGEQFGQDRLALLISKIHNKGAGEIRDEVMAAVHTFADGEQQHDDQTVVVVKAV